MKIFDNVNNILKDDLEVEIKKNSKLSIAAAYFSIYAYEVLKKQLENISELRFIFTSPTFIKEKTSKEKREFYIPRTSREKGLYGTEFEVKLRNELTQKAIARECAEWIRKKVRFKSNRTHRTIQGFISVEGQSDSVYYPTNGFTTVDLGCEKGNDYFCFINKFEGPETKRYLSVFNEMWKDSEQLQDITEEIIENISSVYNENSPEFIYFFTLYNIFNEFLEDINEDVLPNEKTGFKESAIWNKLYNFQKDACLAIINKLEKYNGCILADSVGLGKTFTALSVIKYYEGRNKRVFVLCPKKLATNWTTYQANYLNNPIASDRLRYDVICHTDLSRKKGMSGSLDLEYINWGNYDLVVIDESHNFRTGGKEYATDTNEIKDNRYNFLLKKIIQQGVQTKVLMLSATPVNNRFIDLKHQLALAYEGNSIEFNKKLGEGKDIDNIFREAQRTFSLWDKLPSSKKTAKKLLSMLSFDFINLLDNVSIARSRKHIEEYYNMSDIGKFPERLKPKNLQPVLCQDSNVIEYQFIFETLLQLNLSIYNPTAFIYPSKQKKYEEMYDSINRYGFLRQKDREKGTQKLVSIGLMKRLESSIYSFNKSLEELIDKIRKMLCTIMRHEHNSLNLHIIQDEYIYDDEYDNGYDTKIGEKISISLNDMDYISWKNDLQSDLYLLETIQQQTSKIGVAEDNKLQVLLADIGHKIQNPINPNNKKVIIFTAFSDTAEYLYEHVSTYVKQNFKLNTALITGEINGKCTAKPWIQDMNKALTCFSPISKEKHLLCPNEPTEIDVLIATDCISEGQNLQDCDYLINYDIHWNPVRIIQRFGRIDRIGSKNNVIQLVNFWAPMELDEYIKLRNRVEGRMKIVDITGGGHDNVINPEDEPDLEYRKQQLEKLQHEVVDLEEMGTGISIMDLGLNEFRLDLLDYLKENTDIEHTPFGMNAVIQATKEMPAGVIYILKNINKSTNINNMNRLHPFYMVYIKDDGEVVFDHLHPKELLDKLRFSCKGKTTPDKRVYDVFNTKTQDGRNMEHYSHLLGEAIKSIISVKEESDIDSLFSDGGTSALLDEIKGLNDFELICFLIVEGDDNV